MSASVVTRSSTSAKPAAPVPAAAERHDGGNALPVGSRQAEFEVTRVLGEGGFGIVYLARDHALERLVALHDASNIAGVIMSLCRRCAAIGLPL